MDPNATPGTDPNAPVTPATDVPATDGGMDAPAPAAPATDGGMGAPAAPAEGEEHTDPNAPVTPPQV